MSKKDPLNELQNGTVYTLERSDGSLDNSWWIKINNGDGTFWEFTLRTDDSAKFLFEEGAGTHLVRPLFHLPTIIEKVKKRVNKKS